MSAHLIGVDTNIVVRLLARDDEAQFAKAVQLLQKAADDGPYFLNPLVITETVWILERRMGFTRSEARSKVFEIAQTSEFFVPTNIHSNGWHDWFSISGADFFDIVIAETNAASGCELTLTFDKRAARDVPGMELLQ